MKTMILALLLTSACGVTSAAVEGDSTDPADCCWLFSKESVTSCIQNSIDHMTAEELAVYDDNMDGCVLVRCPITIGEKPMLVCVPE